MHANNAICELSRQRLRDAGIDSMIEDYSDNAFFRVYGASSFMGKKILVPESKLAEARELLNIGDKNSGSLGFSPKNKPFYKIIRLITLIFLLAFIAQIIFSFIANLSIF